MKKVLLNLLCLFVLVACKQQRKVEAKVTTLEEVEVVENDWQVLFNGSSLNQWKEFKSDEISDAWTIEGNALVFTPPAENQDNKIHDLVTKQEFTNFVLTLDWKIAKGGNSGVFWGVSESEKFKTGYETGPEIQILDNENHPDAKAGTTHQAGSLYDMVSPVKDVTKPIGEWNTMVITVNHKEHIGNVVLNGTELVTFPVANEEWNTMVSKSKFADWEGFGKYTTGKIGLQDHGNTVSFRNIKIKELP